MSEFSRMYLREDKMGAKSRLRGHIRCQPVGGGSTLFRAKIFMVSAVRGRTRRQSGSSDPIGIHQYTLE